MVNQGFKTSLRFNFANKSFEANVMDVTMGSWTGRERWLWQQINGTNNLKFFKSVL